MPEIIFVAYDGQGDPNTSKEFQDSMGVIFGLAYTIKFMCKEMDTDFVVMPLEGLWWTDDMSDFSVDNKENWKWTVMIALPDYINVKIFNEAKQKLFAKKELSNIDKARLEKYEDGLSAQILHMGPYAEEPPTIKKLHSFIKEQGYRMHKKHREIYFNSPQRVVPEKLKTIIRQPILKDCSDDQELSAYLEKKISDVEKIITDLKNTRKKLELYKNNITAAAIVPSDIIKGAFAETWICGIRYRGKYSDIGKYFSKLMKKTGRFIKGKALGFYYDLEYKEEDADIEACVATRKKIEVPKINCRLFPETPYVSIVHKGSYGTQGTSYMKLFDYCSKKGYKQAAPIIERYIKGPGFIFTGNPENYLTELIILLQD